MAMLAAVGCILAFGGLTLGAGAQVEDPAEQLRTLLDSDHGYPEVVATVDGDPVYGRELSLRIEMMEQDPTWAGRSVETIALGSLVGDRLLLLKARELGIWPSENEVTERIARIQSEYAKAGAGSSVRTAIDTALSVQGLTIDELQTNQSVRAVYERALAIAKVHQYVWQSLPPAEKGDSDKVLAAQDALLKASWERANIVVEIGVTPELPPLDTSGQSLD